MTHKHVAGDPTSRLLKAVTPLSSSPALHSWESVEECRVVLPGAAGKENTIEQGQMLPHQWGSRVAESCRQEKYNIDVSVQPHPLLSAAAFPPSNHLHLSHILSHPFLTSSARDRRDCNRASISPDLVPTANHCRGLFPLLSSTCGYDMGKRRRGSWCWVAWSGQR